MFLKSLHDWLAPSDDVHAADVTFVLAGRQCRKSFGLKTFEQRLAPTLVLSVGRFEIRRFSELHFPVPLDLLALVSPIKPQQRHVFVTLRGSDVQVQPIPLGRLGTWAEIAAFSEWLQRHKPIRVVNIVTSGFHLRRVRSCCRALLPASVELRFIAVPFEDLGCNRDEWWLNNVARKLVLSELVKVLLYTAFSAARRSLSLKRSTVQHGGMYRA